MKIQVRRLAQHVSIVMPRGRIDAVSGPNFRHLLRSQPSGDALFVIVDLHKVSFMDSSGFSALVAGLKAARQHPGMVHLVRPTHQVHTTLQMSKLDCILPIYESVEDAMEAIASLFVVPQVLTPAIKAFNEGS